jgi:hypothetical protein
VAVVDVLGRAGDPGFGDILVEGQRVSGVGAVDLESQGTLTEESQTLAAVGLKNQVRPDVQVVFGTHVVSI